MPSSMAAFCVKQAEKAVVFRNKGLTVKVRERGGREKQREGGEEAGEMMKQAEHLYRFKALHLSPQNHMKPGVVG